MIIPPFWLYSTPENTKALTSMLSLVGASTGGIFKLNDECTQSRATILAVSFDDSTGGY